MNVLQIQTPMFINIVFFIYFSISIATLSCFFVSFNSVFKISYYYIRLHLFICFFILEKYTLLKPLALVILHHNHSLLTRYDFCHSCIVMFPPIDVPCLLGPPDRGTKKKVKDQKTKNSNNQNFRILSAEAPSSKTSGFFLFF